MKHNVAEKNDLRKYILQILDEKITKLDRFIEFTIEASRDIKKTPKYDSIRTEVQEEIYQLDRQMAELKTMQLNMRRVVNSSSKTVQLGSVVITNKARFYLSVSLGEFFFEGDRFYAISPESPIAKKMMGMSAGEEFVLNKIHQQIVEIF